MLKKISLFLAISTLSANSASAGDLIIRDKQPLAQKTSAIPIFYVSLLRETEHLLLKQSHIAISYFKTDSSAIELLNASPFEVIFEDTSLPKVSVRSGDSFNIPCIDQLGNTGIQVILNNEVYYTAEPVECGDIVYLHITEEVQ